jgi:RimJ/RimL family protein N-acetyltransferase
MDELISERLILRKIVREDVTSIFNNWASDPEVTKFLTWLPHDTIEKTNQIMDFWMKEYEDPKTIRYGIV